MSSSVPRKGILAALWLPTDANGNLLVAELARNLAFLKTRGIHGVLALGSTGEFPQLDLEQRKRALATVAELAAPLPVIANISDIRPGVVAELGRFSRQLGLPAVAIMTPGFFPSSQEDALAHFLHAADAAQLPTFLYNFPSLTGTRINIETVAAFADRANMAGIKQSGGEFEYHKELIALGSEKKFVVFSGADTRLPEVFALGAAGCIGGIVNIAPELMVHLYKVCREGAVGQTSPAFEQMREIGKIIDRLTFPLNVAAGMEARGFATGSPKAIVSPRSKELYRGIVDELRGKLTEWGLAPANISAA
ncbi:dihydrodipicolinate synthase family protein [Oleiharenicola lentus]|uniref:dihydrodipicolinate synthase family protein n=1 Tax=Oleiharenicola lentus TaxID=2508720 RepID=UPI003F67B571